MMSAHESKHERKPAHELSALTACSGWQLWHADVHQVDFDCVLMNCRLWARLMLCVLL